MRRAKGRPSFDYTHDIRKNLEKGYVEGTYFFTVSVGIAMVQKTKEERPPDRKLATAVLIWTRVSVRT
jgi:hypothetical protein